MTLLEQKKYKLIHAIITDTDENRVAEIERLYKKLEKDLSKEPCMYSIDEIKNGLPERLKDLADGKGILHKDVMKEYGL